MIFDACAFVGQWPFSTTRCQSVEDLIRLMDKAGIQKALVSSLAGAFYQNAQESNESLFFEIGRQADRLLMIAACNPSYPGWDKDLKRSVEVLSATGVRLFPNYHGYSLSDSSVSSLADQAAGYGMPVFVSLRLQDERSHPPAMKVPAVSYTDLVALAQAHPKTRFIMSMGRFQEVLSALKETAQTGNLYADIAGIQGPCQSMEKLVAEVGCERLLFGTELMFQYALPARMKIDFSELSPEDRHAIYVTNLECLLGLSHESRPSSRGLL